MALLRRFCKAVLLNNRLEMLYLAQHHSTSPLTVLVLLGSSGFLASAGIVHDLLNRSTPGMRPLETY